MAGINSIQTRKSYLYNHNFSYDNILSGQMGRLIPIQCDEVNPKERWYENIDFVLRMSPLIHPAMTKLNVSFFSFYIPSRIITPRNSAESTWEKFVLSLAKKSDEVPILPSIYTSEPIEGSLWTDEVKKQLKEFFGVGSLADYLDILSLRSQDIDKGTHFEIPDDYRISVMGLLCYLYVYNYWFRRDQIEPEIKCPLSLGRIDLADIQNSEYEEHEEWENPDIDFAKWVNELFKLRYKNYERDYFTSALLEPQFGEDVTVGDGAVGFTKEYSGIIPIAPGNVNLFYNSHVSPDIQGVLAFFGDVGNTIPIRPYSLYETGVDTNRYEVAHNTFTQSSVLVEPVSNASGNSVKTPLAITTPAMQHWMENVGLSANTFTINEFRLAMQLQAVKEVINRGGTRYVEIMQNVYDCVVPDARLQQPVYLGGQKFPISIGSVVQSSQTSDSSALGTLAGKAQAAAGGSLFKSKKQFAEAGYVLTLMCVAPRTGYIGGVPRKWSKTQPIDYFNPYFAHLGEQMIKTGELHFNPLGSVENPNADFGYQERYAEYRHPISRAHGEMRYSKNTWHLYREFDAIPRLGVDFIKTDVCDFTRIFQYTEVDNTSDEMFDIMIHLDIRKKSPVPKYGTPYSFI